MKNCYLLGYPVSHSMSAIMHNAAFKHMELDYQYELLNIKPENLGEVIKNFRVETFGGANVTIPHKVKIMKYLDEVDAEAKRIGAVNTIIMKGDRLKGYNTDGKGAIRTITETYGPLNGAEIVMLGAGGAARAIGYHISKSAGRLRILNRNSGRAKKLARYLKSLPECNSSISSFLLDNQNLENCIKDADILVNTTPIGMSPNVEASPVDAKFLHSKLLVFDAVYNPPMTKLLREAETAGAQILPGLRMLVYQGSESFRMWTGLAPPEQLMLQVIKEELNHAP